MPSDRLKQCLKGETGSSIRPLIWYGGEDKELLIREIRAVKEAGIDEFILENRGGDWFGTLRWYDLLRCALETAESLDMRMWLLDDSHVNTGSANDSLRREENARFRPENLRIEAADFAGPVVAGALMVPEHTDREKVVSVCAFRRDGITGRSFGEPVDLNGEITDGLCPLDLPEGLWRVYFIMTVDPDKEGLFAYYISMVSRESCRHLIDEVYEKTYAHLAPWFGKTFAGFFSDEPAFGNCDGQYAYDTCDLKMGELRRFYPWNGEVCRALAERSGIPADRLMLLLPALWDDVEGVSEMLRVDYMDVITGLWRDNFSRQIGEWCDAHGVEYIGHTLEDRGAHFHTGWGCGHFFRAMAGQHMAGTDIVLNQMVPGFRMVRHASGSSKKEFDSVFYQYTLAKLGSSLAHISPRMAGRAICEVFGAYGWSCSLPVMRAILNHFLAGGTNNFIPHAFSMNLPGVVRKNRGEDRNAPPGYCMTHMAPTFYLGGLNPQYRQFGLLMRYVRRVCHLISGGVPLADAALFYAAEADWSGRPCGGIDRAAMALSRGGVDFDFIPSDTLFDDASVAEGRLRINGGSYGVLAVPQADFLPSKLLRRFAELAAAGLPVIFIDALPGSCEDPAVSAAEMGFAPPVPLAELAEFIRRLIPMHLTLFPASAAESLRYCGMKHADGSTVYLFYNDSGTDAVSAGVKPDCGGECALYDAWENRARRLECADDGFFRITLEPQQLLAAVFTPDAMPDLPPVPGKPEYVDLDPDYDIYLKEAGEKEFRLLRRGSRAVNLLREEKLTRCCGEFRYETVFSWAGGDADVLRIPHAGDCAELILNGRHCGVSLGPVCRFDIAGALRAGENRLVILTADSPAYFDREEEGKTLFGTKLPLAMHGFTGSIQIGKFR